MFKKGQVVQSPYTGALYVVLGFSGGVLALMSDAGYFVNWVLGPIAEGEPQLKLIGNNYRAKPKFSR
ncbi:MAG: hypothetical protein [Bacteriophage sp.]|nr:MAG: hypothetical protein [Bacteriophage sp.]